MWCLGLRLFWTGRRKQMLGGLFGVMQLDFSVGNLRVLCFLQVEKHYCIFFLFFFFLSVMVSKAVCQGLVLMLCSPVNSETFNRHLSLRWSVYVRVCQTAAFDIEQHHTIAPAWECRIADGCDSSDEPPMTVSTCCGKQAGPGGPERAKLQATAWATAGLDSANLPWQMTVRICFSCETTALIELGTHQEIKLISRTCLQTFPRRHAEIQNFQWIWIHTNSFLSFRNSFELWRSQRWRTPYSLSMFYLPTQQLFDTGHCTLKVMFIKGKPELCCKGRFLWVSTEPWPSSRCVCWFSVSLLGNLDDKSDSDAKGSRRVIQGKWNAIKDSLRDKN